MHVEQGLCQAGAGESCPRRRCARATASRSSCRAACPVGCTQADGTTHHAVLQQPSGCPAAPCSTSETGFLQWRPGYSQAGTLRLPITLTATYTPVDGSDPCHDQRHARGGARRAQRERRAGVRRRSRPGTCSKASRCASACSPSIRTTRASSPRSVCRPQAHRPAAGRARRRASPTPSRGCRRARASTAETRSRSSGRPATRRPAPTTSR